MKNGRGPKSLIFWTLLLKLGVLHGSLSRNSHIIYLKGKNVEFPYNFESSILDDENPESVSGCIEDSQHQLLPFFVREPVPHDGGGLPPGRLAAPHRPSGPRHGGRLTPPRHAPANGGQTDVLRRRTRHGRRRAGQPAHSPSLRPALGAGDGVCRRPTAAGAAEGDRPAAASFVAAGSQPVQTAGESAHAVSAATSARRGICAPTFAGDRSVIIFTYRN